MSTATAPLPTLRKPRRRGRAAALVALGILALLAALWLIGYVIAGDRTPGRASSLGVDIGGLSAADAEAKLIRESAAQTGAELSVRVAGTDHPLDPAAAGLGIDAAATVEATGTRSWNPASIVRHLIGGGAVDPVVAVDADELAAAVDGLAATVDRAPVEGDVSFAAGAVTTVEAVAGLELDRDGAAEVLEERYLRGDAQILLPSRETAPAVDGEEVARAVRAFAAPAVSGPVTVQSAGQAIPIEPAEITPALDMTADADGVLQPVLDAAVLREAVAPKLAPLEIAAQDATWRLEGGGPVLVPAVQGRSVTADVLSAAVLPALSKLGAERVAVAEPALTEPALTTAAAEALGVKEKISEFTQSFEYAAYRVQNIGQAAANINGTVLLPGETFSMNAATKERTRANGYTTGFVLSGGRIREALGGGVSTITTAMWTAAFFAGLERVEQRAHSLYISRYQAGLEATVDWGALDLKFKNDTSTAVVIGAVRDNNSVTITMWGTKYYEIEDVSGPRTNYRPFETVYDAGEGCVPSTGQEGFDIVVTRVFRQGGQVVREEPLRTTYASTKQVYCNARPGT